MLLVDLVLCVLLLGLTGYLMYSTYTFRNSTTDEATKKALMQSMIIQVVQMLLGSGLLYTAITTTKQIPPMY